MKKIIGTFLIVALIVLVSTAIYVEPWQNNQDANGYNLTNLGTIAGTMSWSNLTNYPVACPGSGAITTLGDSVTCSDLWVDVLGDIMTGNLSIGGNLTITGKITNDINHIYILNSENNTIGTGGLWYNITFNTSLMDNDGFTLNEDNYTFVVPTNAHYEIDFGAGFVDSASNPTAHIAIRVIVNNVELFGSYIEGDSTKQNADLWLEHTTHAELTTGDNVTFQYISDDTTVSLHQDDTWATQPFNAFAHIQEEIA